MKIIQIITYKIPIELFCIASYNEIIKNVMYIQVIIPIMYRRTLNNKRQHNIKDSNRINNVLYYTYLVYRTENDEPLL